MFWLTFSLGLVTTYPQRQCGDGVVVAFQAISFMNKSSMSSLLLLAAAAVGVCLGGCSTSDSKHTSVVHNLTPELLTLDQRPADAQNTTSLTWNSGNRMFWNDIQRATLTDRPSRLSRHPVPH